MNFSNQDNQNTSPLGASGNESDVQGQGYDDFDEGGDNALDSLSAAGTGRKINSGVLLVLLVVGVAIISLFAMRSLSRASAGGLTTGEIEKMVDEFVQERTAGGAGLSSPSLAARGNTLGMLDTDYTTRQVPLSEVQKNPFILNETQAVGEVDPDDGDSMMREYQRQREARQQAISSAADNLKLQAILMGSSPVANLGGTYLRVGESLVLEQERITFVVKEITHNTVKMVGKDPRFDVEVEITLYLRKP